MEAQGHALVWLSSITKQKDIYLLRKRKKRKRSFYAVRRKRTQEKERNGGDAAAKQDIFDRNAHHSHYPLVYFLVVFEFAVYSHGVPASYGGMELFEL